MSQEKSLNLSGDLTSYYRLTVHGKIENISLKTAVRFRELLTQLSSEYGINFECLSYSVLDSKGNGSKVVTYRIEPKEISEVEPKEISEVEPKEISEVEPKDTSGSKTILVDSLHLETYQTMCKVEQRVDSFLEEEKSKIQTRDSLAIRLIDILLNPIYVIPFMIIIVFTSIFFLFRK